MTLICSWINVSRHKMMGSVESRLCLPTLTILNWIQMQIVNFMSFLMTFMTCNITTRKPAKEINVKFIGQFNPCKPYALGKVRTNLILVCQ